MFKDKVKRGKNTRPETHSTFSRPSLPRVMGSTSVGPFCSLEHRTCVSEIREQGFVTTLWMWCEVEVRSR